MKTNPTQTLKLTEEQEKKINENLSKKPYEPTEEDLEDMAKMIDDNYPFDEEEEPSFSGTIEDVNPNSTIVISGKPVYNFQSAEFQIEISPNNPDHLALFESIYNSLLQILIRCNVDQPSNNKPKEPLATDKQKDLMDKCNIKYSANTTVKEAQKLIDKYFGKE